jgi:hypothetical protein
MTGGLATKGQQQRTWRYLVLWLLSILPLTLLGLHSTAILPLRWTEQPVSGLRPVALASYGVPLGGSWMSTNVVGESPAMLFEDGRPLQCPNAQSADIAQRGGGRFRLADDWLFLSASDNSDPRTNGRRYLLRWPTPPASWLIVLCQAIAVSGTVMVVLFRRREISASIRAPLLAWCLVIVLAVVAAHRWWFFVDVPLPSIQPDSDSYFALAQLVGSSQWPHFEIRPPAYPLFLRGALRSTRSLFGVIIVQTLLSVASAIVMVVGAHRLKPALAPGVTIAMAAFLTGLWHIEHDTSILSETLYVNCIVFGIGFLILGFASGNAVHFAAASTALGLTILTRPAGLFLLAPFVLSLAFLLWNRHPLPQTLAFAVPLPLLLFALSSYNYYNAGVFAVTAWGEANLAVATFTMWDTRPDYPEKVNAEIREVRALIQERLTDEDRAALASSWDPEQLAPIFLKGFYQPALDRASRIGETYLDSRRWIRRISIDAVRTHPSTYAKFVRTMAYLFYVRNIRYRADLAVFLNFRMRGIYDTPVEPTSARAALFGFFSQRRPVALAPKSGCEQSPEVPSIVPTVGRRVHRVMQEYRDDWFGASGWAYAAGIVLVIAVLRLALSGGRHMGAMILTMIGATAVAAGLIVCLVEYASHRYSYPTEFAYYVTVALAPLLWVDLSRGHDAMTWTDFKWG